MKEASALQLGNFQAPRVRVGELWSMFVGIQRLGTSAVDLAAMSLTINVLSLAVPLVTMQVYDRILPNQTLLTFRWLAIGALIALALEGLMKWLRSSVGSWITARFEHIMGQRALHAILATQSPDRKAVGDYLDTLGGIPTLSNQLINQFVQAMLDLPFAILFIVAIGWLNPWLAIVPLACLALYAGLIAYARTRYEREKLRQEDVTARRYNLIIHILQSLHLVKAQALEEPLLRQHESLQAETAQINLQAGFWSRLPQDFGPSVNQFATLCVIALGAPFVSAGELTLGALSACMMLTSRSMQPFQGLLNFWLRSTEAFVAYERLAELLALTAVRKQIVLPPLPREIEGSLSIRNLHFRYGPDQPYLFKGLNLEASDGTMLAISGRAGTGASTLLRLLGGFLPPEQGTIAIGNYNLAQWDLSDTRGRIEFVPASGTLFRGTILDNLTMFQPQQKLAALEAASLLDLDAPISLLPAGYETEIDANHFLPSGLVQRIVMARALVLRPRVLLLDDPTASLDTDTESTFTWLLSKLHGRCTIVLATNSPQLLARADMCLDLERGDLLVQRRDD